MNDLLRPAMYQAYHGMVEVVASGAAPQVMDVVGPVCESSCWLGRDRTLAVMQGDVIAILSAGAYSMSMASNYNIRTRGAEVLVSGDQIKLVRPRETVANILASQIEAL
jgi:diaminopimelate decarboxylase